MADVKKVRASFPLAWKLSLAVSAVLVFSLGIIIFSVWILFRSDAAKTAVSDNDSINFRVAAAAESTLKQIRSDTTLLLGSVDAGNESGNLVEEKLSAYYFEHNPVIAAVVSVSPLGSAKTMINGNFARINEISPSLFTEYLNLSGNRLLSVSSETLLVNASEDFYGLPILAAAFPYTTGTRLNIVPSTAIVFFSSGSLSDYFGYGASRSFLLSNSLDILLQGGEGSEEHFFSNPAVYELNQGGGNHLTTSYQTDSSKETKLPGILPWKKDTVFASVRRIDFDALVLTTVPGSVVFEGIFSTTRRNLYLAIFVWFISLFFIGIFSSRLTRQLGILQEAAEAIEDGLYRRDIQSKSRDETGFLAERMNSMRTALQNFERFTNKQIARLTRRGLLAPGGTTKNAVFLFSDIRSFTAISEQMDPSLVVSFLNDYMESMVACIMVTGGVIDKYIGDAILAHWGAVTDEEQDGNLPQNEALYVSAALRSALLMRATLQCFNQETKNRPVIKMGCGISSGQVVAGQIGTEEHLVYTVIGDAVHNAEQAESCNKPLGTETLLTSRINKIAGEGFITESLSIKKGKSTNLFALINVLSKSESALLMSELEQLKNINMDIARRCIGPEGPATLGELRKLLGITEPDLNRIRINEREKKFKIQEP